MNEVVALGNAGKETVRKVKVRENSSHKSAGFWKVKAWINLEEEVFLNTELW